MPLASGAVKVVVVEVVVVVVVAGGLHMRISHGKNALASAQLKSSVLTDYFLDYTKRTV